jgi:hypothetical protein
LVQRHDAPRHKLRVDGRHHRVSRQDIMNGSRREKIERLAFAQCQQTGHMVDVAIRHQHGPQGMSRNPVGCSAGVAASCAEYRAKR